MSAVKRHLSLFRPGNAAEMTVVCFLGYILTSGFIFDFKLILAVLAVFFVGAGCFAINDYFDYEVDCLGKPGAPLSSGDISRKTALILALFVYILALGLSWLVNIICFGLACWGVGTTILYSWRVKGWNRGLWGNILISLDIASIWIYGAYINGSPSMGMLSIVAQNIVAMFCGEILLDVRDERSDKLWGIKTFAASFGSEVAVRSYFFPLSLIANVLHFVPYFMGFLGPVYLLIVILSTPIDIWQILKLYANPTKLTAVTLLKLYYRYLIPLKFVAYVLGIVF